MGLRSRAGRAVERVLARDALPPPLSAEQKRWSIISSVHDQSPPPSEGLIDLGLKAAGRAREIDLSSVAERVVPEARFWVSQFPGEHYRLLAALADIIKPAVAVEVGTFTGMGALAIRSHMPAAGRVVTYDVVDWRAFPETLLRAEDLESRIEQRLGDLSDPSYFEGQRELLRSASMIFVDGPKDGRFEARFFELLLPAITGSQALLVIDDIRLLNMVSVWRSLPVPKLDLTSFGHWSGTGLAEVT